MKSVGLKLLSFLAPAAIAVGFLIWWFSPTQSVLRANKALLETFEVRALSLENKPELNKRFGEFVNATVEVSGPDPIPNEILDREELLSLHRRFQNWMLASELTVSNSTVRFITPAKAFLRTDMQADLKLASGQRRVMRYQLALTYEKSGKNWLLSKVQAHLR